MFAFAQLIFLVTDIWIGKNITLSNDTICLLPVAMMPDGRPSLKYLRPSPSNVIQDLTTASNLPSERGWS